MLVVKGKLVNWVNERRIGLKTTVPRSPARFAGAKNVGLLVCGAHPKCDLSLANLIKKTECRQMKSGFNRFKAGRAPKKGYFNGDF